MVPLPGHTWAIGVAVQQQGSWLLHAGAAYFFRGELDPAQRTCPPGLRPYHDGSGSPRAAWQPAAAARACRRAQRRCRRLLRPRSRRAYPPSAALPARLWTACDERRRSSAGERLACPPPPAAGIARRMHKRTGVAVGTLESRDAARTGDSFGSERVPGAGEGPGRAALSAFCPRSATALRRANGNWRTEDLNRSPAENAFYIDCKHQKGSDLVET